MYITEFFGMLDVVPVEDGRAWAVRCTSSKMVGYAESVIAALRADESGRPWSDDLFSVLTNFAVHVLRYENCGLVSGASGAGTHRAIRLGNLEKDVEFSDLTKSKRILDDQMIGRLKRLLLRRARHQKPLALAAVHNIAVNALPFTMLPRSNVDALDFLLIFDGDKQAVERNVRKLRRRPWFVPSNLHKREFTFGDKTPWVVILYAHKAVI